jgi:hypothetical protein
MLKIIFRILFLGLGLFTTYSFGRDTFEPLWHRLTGTCVEGRIVGFLAGKYSPSVQPEPTGVRKGKRRARRPVFAYPVAPGAVDSLQARSSTGGFLIFGSYTLNEHVSVVFNKNNPANAYLFGWELMLTAFFVTLLGLFMIRIGLTGKL